MFVKKKALACAVAALLCGSASGALASPVAAPIEHRATQSPAFPTLGRWDGAFSQSPGYSFRSWLWTAAAPVEPEPSLRSQPEEILRDETSPAKIAAPPLLQLPPLGFALNLAGMSGYDDEASCGFVFEGKRLHLREGDPWAGSPIPKVEKNDHVEKDGAHVEYDIIMRRADRPIAYDAYRYPIPSTVSSGFDLDRPDKEQRRGKMNAVGHGGVDLWQEKGTPIKMLALDYQVGDAEVLWVGRLMGKTVVTRHSIREGGRRRDYVMVFGHLDEVPDDIYRGRRVRVGETIGTVGDSDSPEFVHLHLEIRRVRDGIDVWKLLGGGLTARETTIVTDPRNLLPRKSPNLAPPHCAKRPLRSSLPMLGVTTTLALDNPAGLFLPLGVSDLSRLVEDR